MQGYYIPFITAPNDMMTAVGCICSWWQQVEVMVETTIWRWAGLSQKRGRCITGHMSFPLQCDVLKALAHAKFNNPVYDAVLQKFIEKQIRPAHLARNRFAHALFLDANDVTALIVEKPHRHRPGIIGVEIDIREAFGAGAKILAAAAALAELTMYFDDGSFEPQAWQQTLRGLISRYDRLIAERTRHLAKKNRNPRRPRSSRP